ncbi:MAG: transposase, partial [Pseudomonadota bacterium]
MIRLLFSMAVLVGLGIFAYKTGTVLAKREVVRLAGEVESQAATIAALRDENAKLAQQAKTAGQTEAEWRERYPQVADKLEEETEDTLAFFHFPSSHRLR